MNDWTVVDEGWGRRSVEFATLSEPANCREYLALHQLLDVTRGHHHEIVELVHHDQDEG